MGLFQRKNSAKTHNALPENPQNHDDNDDEDSINQIEPDEEPMVNKVGDTDIESQIPDLNGGATGKAKSANTAILVGGGLFATGLIVAGLILAMGGESTESAQADKQKLDMVQNQQKHDFNAEKLEIKADEAKAASDVQAASAADTVPPIETVEQNQPQPQAPQARENPVEPAPQPIAQNTAPEPAPVSSEPEETPQQRKLRGNVLVEYGNERVSGSLNSENNGAIMATDGNQANLSSENGDTATDNSRNQFASSLNPTATPSTRAFHRGDRTYLMNKGTNITCTLETKIVTTLSGFTRCLVTKDVYSANGKVLLLERGTKIIGEQTSALLQGQARVFVLWNEAETTRGVKINLASPAAGQLGEAGVGARVKYHFWQRFGGAVMISLIGDLGDYYSNRANQRSNGQNISFENSSETAQDMAAEALRNSINIPPTGYINQGTIINIMVARDVDFSGVYERVNPYLMN